MASDEKKGEKHNFPEVEYTGITKQGVVFAFVCSLLVGLYFAWSYGFTFGFPGNLFTNNDEYGSNPAVFYGVLFLISIFAAVAGKRLGLTKHDLTATYTGVMISLGLTLTGAMVCGPYFHFYNLRAGEPYLSYSIENLPNWWSPKGAGVYDAFALGGGLVDWGLWMPYVLNWNLLWVSYLTFFVALAVILRRIHVETQAMPFPLTQGWNMLIVDSTSKEGESRALLFKDKLLWLGVLIGFAVMIPQTLHYLMPGFPAYYKYLVDLTPYIKPASYTIDLVPAVYAIAFLMPTNVLLTSAISAHLYTLFIFLPLMAGVAVVYWNPSGDSMSGIWSFMGWQFGKPDWPNLFPAGMAPMIIGSLSAAMIWAIWSNRGIIGRLLKGIVSPLEEDKTSPIPYRVAWIILILSGIGMIGWMMYSGISLTGSILVLAIWIFVWWGALLMRGEAAASGFGTLAGSPQSYYWLGFALFILTTVMGYPRGQTFVEGYLVLALVWQFTFYYWTAPSANPLGHLMEMFKLGEITKTKSRHLWLIALIIGPIVAFMTSLITLQMGYTLGVTKGWKYSLIFGSSNLGPRYAQTYMASGMYYSGPTGNLPWQVPLFWIELIIVFAVCISLYQIARKRPLPIAPIGIAIGFFMAFPLGFVFLASWIVKTIVMRVGGMKLYQEKGVPLAVGLAVGTGLAFLLQGVGVILTGIY